MNGGELNRLRKYICLALVGIMSTMAGFTSLASGMVVYDMNATAGKTTTKYLDGVDLWGIPNMYVGDTPEMWLFYGKPRLIIKDTADASFNENVELKDVSMITGWNTTSVVSKMPDLKVKDPYDGNKSVNVDVQVREKPNFSKYEFLNVTKTYKVGAPFDGNGTVRTYAADGTYEDNDIKTFFIKEFSTERAGKTNLVLRRFGIDFIYEINVTDTGEPPVEKAVKKIELSSDVTKKYKQNEKFDGKGSIRVIYNDNSTEQVPLTEGMLTGFDTSKFGSYVVVVTYGGQKAQYTIFVDRVSSTGNGNNSSSGGSSGGSSSSGSSSGWSKRPTHFGGTINEDATDNKKTSGSFSSSGSSNKTNTTTTTQHGFNSKGRPKNIPNHGLKKVDVANIGTTLQRNGQTVKNEWVGDGSNWYYAGPDGGLMKGWQYINGQYYLLNQSTGECEYGWRLTKSDNKWYFLSPDDGHLCQGWNVVDGTWYYMTKADESKETRPTGSMWANETTPDGYKVNSSGAWVK